MEGCPEPANFALFFLLSSHYFHSFFLSWGSFRGIGGVIENRDPQMCTFGVLGLSCEAPFWAVRWRGSSGGGVGQSAQILDALTKILNTHRTDTPHHTTTQQQRHTTHWGIPHRSWARGVHRRVVHGPKTRHEQHIVRRAAPLAQKTVSKEVWPKVVQAKCGQKNRKTKKN